jgi:hypothetical protein
MSILRQAKLVSGRKRERWMYYRLPGKSAPEMVHRTISLVRQATTDDPRIREDAERMKKILETDKELICERQSIQRKKKTAAQQVAVIA